MHRACWIQHGGEYAWAPHIASEMARQGVDTYFVTTLQEGESAYRAAGWPTVSITDVAFDERRVVTDNELVELDERYGPPLLRATVESDLHLQLLYGSDTRRALAVVARAIAFWEDHLDRNDVDALIVRETQSFATRTAYVVSRRRGGPPILRIDIGPSDEWFTMSDVDEDACSTDLLAELESGPRDLTHDERRQVDELVATRARPLDEPGKLRDVGLPLWRVPNRWVREWVKELLARRRGDHIGVAAQRLRRRVLLRRSLARVTRHRFPYDDQPSARFVYFPIPFRDEGMLRAKHAFWVSHLHDLVAAVARSLPSGVELVVKEHPGVPGDQSWRDLARLRTIPRVRLVRPTVNTLSLIHDADAVFVLGGTAGWESFLARTPVVVLAANPYYARSDLVYRVADVDRIEEVLATALRRGRRIYDEREREWAWFIHATLATASAARFFKFEFPYYTDEHLPAAARAMAARILRCEREPAT